ncbi:AMP-dependent synthetase [Nocardioides glacieisoli]|uniref:AMP-dependent synthetase n=1 Tax=Nocardioides glacieisoli TaxID=1168730 RepID=A0A4Q2RU13_9ACTN|nr:AMP-binding protein [Nocardioides glacieisoli]RYB92581.1 AMP-dependent synthetase [Nocardioides glacieisoli]
MEAQAANAGELLLSRGAPDDIVIVDAGGRHTYADLRRAVAHQTQQLQAWHLEPGDRVALLGANSLFWVASYLAILRSGLTAVPLPPVLTAADVADKMAHVGCVTLLVDERLTRRYGTVVEAASRVGTSAGVRDLLSGTADCPLPAARRAADTAVLVFTSGTTSRPRAVMVSHANVVANTASIVDYLGLRRDDRMLVVLPFSYCFGASLLHTHLATGASLVICETQAFPETIVEAIAEEECTGFAGVPSSYQLLLRASSFESRPLPSLRHLQQAGGRLPVAHVQRVVEAQPHARLFVMYGQTEATARLAFLPPEQLAAKVGSVGKAVPGVRLRVTGDDGVELPPGTVGEIRVRGANVTRGYWQDVEGTAEKYVDGELRTGDFGRMDQDGFLYVVDRGDDFIKSWGYRVSSHEVEDAALELSAVAGAAAVGRPDTEAGEAVVLFATLRPDHQLAVHEIEAHLRARLAKHLVPQEVRLLDQLPLNQNGKVVKTRLRELARDDVRTPEPEPEPELVEAGGRRGRTSTGRSREEWT